MTFCGSNEAGFKNNPGALLPGFSDVLVIKVNRLFENIRHGFMGLSGNKFNFFFIA